MPQPAPNRVRLQEIGIVVAFDQQLGARIHDVDVEIEGDEALGRLHTTQSEVAEVEGGTDPVNIEHDGDERRPARIALDRQPGYHAAKGDVGMGQSIEETRTKMLEEL